MRDAPLDQVLAGAMVVDGTGAGAYRADVGIADDKIVAIGDLTGRRTGQRVDVDGKVITPGFIDTHTHDDGALLTWPAMPMKASQGVTTVVIGNCGVSLAPLQLSSTPPAPLDQVGGQEHYAFGSFRDYFLRLESEPPAVNVAALVGHMTLRVATMDRLDRAASAAEASAMASLLEEGLDAGALGFSTGLAYAPSAAAPTDEVFNLVDRVGRHGGIYCTHLRDEGNNVMQGLCEACEVAARARIPLVVSHHKVLGRENFGRSAETLAYLDKLLAHQAIAIDAYPYAASSTMLRLDRVFQSERVLITWSRAMPSAAGLTLAAIQSVLGVSKEEAVSKLSPAGAVYFSMSEDDVRRILSWPRTMIGSDGIALDAFPHPRLWGTFPRVLGHYARDLGLMSFEQAVHRMTGLAAETFGLKNRGQIQEGYFADLVVLDRAAVADVATFDSPAAPSAGIDQVFVNGRLTWSKGAPCANRPGRVLKRQQQHPPMRNFQRSEAARGH
jgi:N-acyl-D-amino-acid deacylase